MTLKFCPKSIAQYKGGPPLERGGVPKPYLVFGFRIIQGEILRAAKERGNRAKRGSRARSASGSDRLHSHKPALSTNGRAQREIAWNLDTIVFY